MKILIGMVLGFGLAIGWVVLVDTLNAHTARDAAIIAALDECLIDELALKYFREV